MKIAVLYDVWQEEVAAPEPPEPKPVSRKKKSRKKAKREKEDREEIFEALEKLGHQPSYLVLDGTQQGLSALLKCEADLIFNLTESFAGDDTKEMHVAAYMDLLG
jgi:D-alanine-D-alanine ligase